jgi:hypothetical protein
MKKALWFLLFPTFLSSCSDDGGGGVTPLDDKFSSIQTQTFDRTCNSSSCHGGSFPKALLDLTASKSYEQLLGNIIQNTAAKDRYRALVVPGKPDSSFLYIKLKGPRTDEGVQMPERLPAISAPELEAIRIWIQRGAPND